MKHAAPIAAVMAALVSLSASPSASLAQHVAVVDVGAVFKAHPQYTRQLNLLQEDADKLRADAQQDAHRFQQLALALQELSPGSPEYRQRESQLAQMSASSEVDRRNRMRELMQREAQLHYDIYRQVNRVIAEYCQERGFRLVLRHVAEETDPNDPQSVLQQVNGDIVYVARQYDITQQIIQRISQPVGGAPGSNVQR